MDKTHSPKGGRGAAASAAAAILAAAVLLAGWLMSKSGLARLSGGPSPALQALRISEVQNHNALTLVNEYGEASSWIEIENTGDGPVSLHGVCLAKDAKFNKTFVFPDIALEAGGYALVYADGRAASGLNGALHAAFGLPSAGGTTLYLFDAAENLLDSVEVPGMEADEVWCRGADGAWTLSAQATPGAANDVVAARGLNVRPGDVALSEAVSANAAVFPDENGEYGDYVELHNLTDRAVNLAGYWLSDSAERPNKWQFPGVTVPANGYLAVHCDGVDRRENPAHLHANFRLSAGETVYLAEPGGAVISVTTLPELACGQAWSYADGWTDALPPTPNLENTWDAGALIDAQGRAARASAVVVSEVMASPEDEKYDWVELYNAGDADADLSGFGLSDRPDRPRRWQFPDGTVLRAHEYTAVFLTGGEGGGTGGYLSAPFALSADGGYTVCLSDPDGVLLDAMYVPQQYPGISYGRSDAGECGYFPSGTPLAANGARALGARAERAAYSVPGGLYTSGETFSVALTAATGARIYYTLDCSDPTEASALYDGTPIPVSGTTVLRTRVYQDGRLPSLMDAQSYLYDVPAASESPYVLSLVSDPTGLYSDETGIMVKGPNATAKFPFGDYGKGANFWMDWEREAHVELYTGAGDAALSQECGIKLHGRNTRAYELKSFKVMAKGRYGDDRFRYPIFRDRPYDEYEAFILRYSGQDYKTTFMRDAVLTSLAENTSVMYMEAEECIVYLNGAYYSAMYIRENISPFSLARREGWTGQEGAVDLVKSGYDVKQGSNESYIALKAWLDSHDNTTEEAYQVIDAAVDIDNFIEYATLQIFIGPPDTVNVKRYRNTMADARWRWVIYDVDRGMREDIDGFALLAQGTNAQLFRACMANPAIRDRFLAHLNTALATYLSAEHVVGEVQAQFERIRPLLPEYLSMMGIPEKHYASRLRGLRSAIGRRPAQVLRHCAEYLNLSEADVNRLFPDAIAAIRAYGGSVPASSDADAADGDDAGADDGLTEG